MKKLISLWMMVLVLSIPFYSSTVIASSLDISVSGSRGVAGFRTQVDTLNVKAIARQNFQNIALQLDESKLQLVHGNIAVPFSSCAEDPDIQKQYFCNFIGIEDQQISPSSVQVRLLKDDGSVEITQNGILRVDNVKPVINNIEVTQDSSGLFVSYDIRDDGSGIGIVQIISDANTLASNDYGGALKVNDRIKIDSFGSDSRNRQFIVLVEDRMGLQSAGNRDKYIDFDRPRLVTKPVMLDTTIGSHINGRVINSIIPDFTTEIEVYANFTDDSELSVVADLSDYGGDRVAGERVSEAVNPNNPNKKIFAYKWKIVSPQANDRGRITFTIIDVNGNINTVQENYPLPLERVAPSLIDFKYLINGVESSFLGSKDLQNIGAIAVLKEDYPGLIKSGVKLDLRNIGGGNNQVASECKLDENWECKWDNLIINKPIASNRVVLNVTDLAGNSNEINVQNSIGVDATVPVIDYFGSTIPLLAEQNNTINEVVFNGYLNKTNNVIIARIIEDASGIQKDLVRFIGLNGLYKADECTKLGDVNTCIWNDSVSKLEISNRLNELKLIVEDNAGNRIEKISNLLLDTQAPVFESISIFSINSKGKFDFHKGFDALEIIVIVQDDSQPTAFFRSQELGFLNAINNECKELEQGRWECLIETPPMPISGGNPDGFAYELAVFDVNGNKKISADAIKLGEFSDTIGGRIEDDKLKIDVALSTEIPALDLFELKSITAIPGFLDREILQIIDQRQFFDLKFESQTAGNPEIVQIDLVENSCELSDPSLNEKVLEIGMMNNNGKDKTNPFVFVDIAKGRVGFDEIHMTCSVAIRSFFDLKGKRVTVPRPEIDNVTFTMQFINSPLGELGENLQDKIDDIRGDWIGPDSGFAEVIGILTKIANIAKGICTMLGVFGKVLDLLSFIGISLDGLSFFPGLSASPQEHCTRTEGASSSFREAYQASNKFCQFMSCDISLGEGIDAISEGFKGEIGVGTFFGKNDAKIPGPKAEKGVVSKIEDGIQTGVDFVGDPISYVSGEAAADSLEIKLDPFKSLPLAIIQLCIPGIIAGFEKYRQVNCMYVDCLENQVPEIGIPVDACDASFHYLQCKYVYGDFLNLIPWVQIYDYYVNFIKQMVQDPLALVGTVIGYVCLNTCTGVGGNAANFLCRLYDFATLSLELFQDLDQIFGITGEGPGIKGLFKPANDFCSELDGGGGLIG